MVLAATPGPSIDMSQSNEQEQGGAPAKPKARKGLELFWRIIAGLMLITIGWIAWVLYQIAPRSVVTPMAYAHQVQTVNTRQSAADTAVTISSPASTVDGGGARPEAAAGLSQASPEAAAAVMAMDQAQAAARDGAHQASADVQAAAMDERKERLQRAEPLERDGLKLSTEITTPLAERKRTSKKQ